MMAATRATDHFMSLLQETPSISELCEHVILSSKWYQVGVQLKLNQQQLDFIEMENKAVVDKICKMFQLWLDTDPQASRQSLLAVLRKEVISEHAIADKYEKTLIDEIIKMSCDIVSKAIWKHYHSLSHNITDVVETARMLCTERVLVKETLDEVGKLIRSEDDQRRALLCGVACAVSENPAQLRVFAEVLLRSERTVSVANDMLKEYKSIVSPPLSQQNLIANEGLVTCSPPEVIDVNLQEASYRCDFQSMRVIFSNFLNTIADLIPEKVPSPRALKNYLRRGFPELKAQLEDAGSCDDIIDVVLGKCTILDVSYLEAIVEFYDVKEAKPLISTYKVSLEQFCSEVGVKVCCDQSFKKDGITDCLLECETVQFVLEWNAEGCVLNDIRALLKKAFKQKVVLVKITEGNSITVTCYAPKSVIDLLLMEVDESLDVLEGNGLVHLKIGHSAVWPDKKRHNDDVRVFHDKIGRLKMELEENNERHRLHMSELQCKVEMLNKIIRMQTLEKEQLKSQLYHNVQPSDEIQKEIEELQELVTVLSQHLTEKEEEIMMTGDRLFDDLQFKKERKETVSTAETLSETVHSHIVVDEAIVKDTVHGSNLLSYKMNDKGKCHGYALIINNINIVGRHKRMGTQRDHENLSSCLTKLGYRVRVYIDQTAQQMRGLISKFAKETDHSECDSFFCCLMSQGDAGKLYGSDDRSVHIEDVKSSFFQCPSLMGKPKIFVIESSRGTRLPSAVQANTSTSTLLPEESDFLFCYSTTPFTRSCRFTDDGSWHILQLCKTLTGHHKEKDLLQMVQLAGNAVATDPEYTFEFNERTSDGRIVIKKYKQAPQIVSTLRHPIYF